MTAALATPGAGSALWYLSRATGVVSLGLLTLVVLLGVLTVGGVPLPGLPRFAVSGLHRNASLLALAFLGIHITTSVLDPYASIKVVDAVVPFASSYRPLWLGLGAIAFDLLLAVIVTSFLRLRIGRRWFRAVHLATYLAWPVALVHGLGTGSDTKQGWMLLFTVLAVVAVVSAVLWRLVDIPATSRRWRVAGGMVALVAPMALAGWMALGPLAPHWAARAGTPVALRASAVTSSAGQSASALTGASPRAPTGQAAVSGTVGGDRWQQWPAHGHPDRTVVRWPGWAAADRPAGSSRNRWRCHAAVRQRVVAADGGGLVQGPGDRSERRNHRGDP